MTRKSKLRLNAIAIFISLVILAVFVSVNFVLQDSVKNDVGSYFIKSYEKTNANKVDIAILSLEKGDVTPAIELLDAWKKIETLDRLFPLKRKVILSLSRHLHAKKQFRRLLNVSKSWSIMDERDVTGMAYFHEATRHLPGYGEKGLLGLIALGKRFPLNVTVRQFLTEAADGGNLRAAATLCTLEPYDSGWRVYTFKTLGFAGIESVLDLEPKEIGNRRYRISVDVPGDTAILRLDTPYGVPIRLKDVVLAIDGREIPIPSDDIKLVRMKNESGWLVAPGGLTSFLYFNSVNIFRNITVSKVSISFVFTMDPDTCFELGK
jgi:hypothetical protein